MSLQSVTLNFHGHYGYLDYNEDTHEFTVCIQGQPEAEKAVRDFLSVPRTMDVPTDESCTYHFHSVTLNAKDGWDSCRQLLTRLWVNTDVLVEWSMPPRMAENI